LLHFFQSPQIIKKLLGSQVESARPNLSLTDIRNFKITYPNLDEQTAIATALNDDDILINQLEKLLTKKRNIKTGAMQELLKPKEGWEEKTLGEVARFRRGSFPQPYGLDKWYDDTDGFPFVQVFDVDDNMKLKPETKRHISESAQKMSVFVEKGSIVFTIQGSIGRIAITQYDAYVDRTLLLFESYILPFNKYYFMLLIHVLFEQEKQRAPGGTIKTITKQALSNFKISYPKIEEQNRTAQILSDMDNEIHELEKKIAKYKMIKQGMMQSLLTGKIRLM
jgi:type I restriction enzyme S subunit